MVTFRLGGQRLHAFPAGPTTLMPALQDGCEDEGTRVTRVTIPYQMDGENNLK